MLINRKKIIELDSTRESIHIAEKFVEEICDIYNIFNSYFANITLAVTEAVENAIIHGNNSDPGKKVVLDFDSSNAALIFTIADQGQGFDPLAITDPTEDENDSAGRGLYLMKTLSDNMNFNDNGNSVSLVFEIASINQQTSVQRRKNLQEYMQGEKIRLNDQLNYGNETG